MLTKLILAGMLFCSQLFGEIKCRTLVVTSKTATYGAWQKGEEGCARVMKEASSGQEIFNSQSYWFVQVKSPAGYAIRQVVLHTPIVQQ